MAETGSAQIVGGLAPVGAPSTTAVQPPPSPRAVARPLFGEPEPSTEGSHVIDIPDAHEPQLERMLEPLQAQQGTLRCRVRRLDRQKLELYIETGYVFLLSATKSGKDWLITDQLIDTWPKRPHMARLRTHKDGTFTCVRSRFEHASSGPPELLFIRHRSAATCAPLSARRRAVQPSRLASRPAR